MLRILHLFAALATAAGLSGCAYRLYAPVPPSEERVKIGAKSPDRYVLHIEEHIPTVSKSDKNALRMHVAHVTNYPVPSDGLVTIRVPSYRPYCGVYLFNWIKVGGGGDDALKDWEVSVLYEVRSVRTLTLKDAKKLPMDATGYHVLKVPD